MQTHFSLNDHELELQFKNRELSTKLFCHEAHLRLAWIHLKRYGEEKAIKNLTQQITAFANKNGAPNKFNMTLTTAAIKAVHHFLQKSSSSNFRDFMKEFPRLKTRFKELMAAHYGFDIYNSQVAKTKFLAPDLLPFD